jgi:raffinose/stachyose/melibiose transport system permease protein
VTHRMRKHLFPYLFLLPTLVLMIIFIYLPIVQNVIFSLYRWSAFSIDWSFVGIENYTRALSDPLVFRSLGNNVWYAVISVAVQVVFALCLAAIIESKLISRFAGNLFRTALFLPSVLSISVVGITWQLMYSPVIGLINQLLTVIGLGGLKHAWLGEEGTAIFAIIGVSQWQWTGYIMILFIVAIQAIPQELYEAAHIDGANGFRQFLHITVPGVRETFLVTSTITIIGAFRVFDIVYVMTSGGPNRASEVLGNYMYRSGFRNDEMGYASALATILFILTFALSIVQLRVGRTGKETG